MTSKPYPERIWPVDFAPKFDAKYAAMPEDVQDELMAQAGVIERSGPSAGRPRANALKELRHANMKEL